MADSFGKKDREKKKRKKREDKAERKAQRREEDSGSDIMYVHPDGQLRPTPPDLTDQVEIEVDDIVLGAQNNIEEDESPIRKGKVSFFNHDKGFGFIVDNANNNSVFVHVDGCIDDIEENSKVVFETKKGPKGMMAFNVQLKENYVPPVVEKKEGETAEGSENTEATAAPAEDAEKKEEKAEESTDKKEEKKDDTK